ncbi:MAG: tRNA glutamyl-Q(34) synthetase GluQRS [Sideroxydans sp.]|nr:tRNA glutamyl-Q(34) synthetase GluQRS [Sideroxydans sp.]
MTYYPKYRGRFAPSPTGPLHFGSLVAAVGSYLEAKHRHGTWLIRVEDLDTPRCAAGATEDILSTMEVFGMQSDEPVIHQSQRTDAYEEALQRLKEIGAVYPCCCTRREITDSAMQGIEGLVYPGTCRSGMAHQRSTPAWRVRTDHLFRHSRAGGNDGLLSSCGVFEFDDALQGHLSQNLESEIGDFVVKRADGLFAYQLAVVVDDAAQGITHVVRGADLLNSTPRQIHLQRLLGLPTPAYLHLPVAVNEAREKLSKQTLAAPVDVSQAVNTLMLVLHFLRQAPPVNLANGDVHAVLDWAIQNWDATQLTGLKTQPYTVIPALR